MKKHITQVAPLVLVSSMACLSPSAFAADTFTDALTSGKAYGDVRLRYEAVEQNNALKDAKAITVRTRLGYTMGDFNGFSAGLEFEDSRTAFDKDDYSVKPTGQNVDAQGNITHSVVADPEATELDQAFVAYKNGTFKAKLGRQVIALDDQRFVGHVGWRQDRQTFDALTLGLTPAKGLALKYAYISQRNRILADKGDIDSKDHLLNASYKTPLGKLTGFAYLLENDNDTDNGLDTYGVSFTGKTGIGNGSKLLYKLAYAKQDSDPADKSANYYLVEGGVNVNGITAKLGYEVLGSDDGKYGFVTPLATLHKFNGWSDQFLGTPAQGLVDLKASLSGKALGGKWVVAYHDFSADEGTAGADDFGNEINLLYAKKFAKNYNAGIKYASYSAEDIKVDADKLWLWVGASF